MCILLFRFSSLHQPSIVAFVLQIGVDSSVPTSLFWILLLEPIFILDMLLFMLGTTDGLEPSGVKNMDEIRMYAAKPFFWIEVINCIPWELSILVFKDSEYVQIVSNYSPIFYCRWIVGFQKHNTYTKNATFVAY